MKRLRNLSVNVVVLATILLLLITTWHDLFMTLSSMLFMKLAWDKWLTKRGREDDDRTEE